ncbi:MAG: Rne/Rng family ribonuclease, partial [Phycisphaerae bacterium]
MRDERGIAEPIEPRFDVDANAEPSSRSRRRRRRRRRGRGDGTGAAERPAAGAAAEPLDEAGDAETGPEAFESPGDIDVESIRDELADVDVGADEQTETEPLAELETQERAEESRGRRRRRRGRRMRSDSEIADFALSPGPDVIMDAEAEPAGAPESQAAPAPAARKEMIINVVPHEECRISILEDGRLQEIYLERASAENHVGNIYKGVVTNVEPSIQAAFVDFGLGKNGFLHISDLHPQYFPNGEGNTEDVGRKMPRRHRPPIQRCVRRGQELLVQITKEGIGTKGPTLTTYLSVPGRYLVMMPGMRQLGVSRKIEDEEVRRKIRAVLNELDLPDDIGFIARTAAEGRTRDELQSDLNYLTRLWRAVQNRIRSLRAPTELYRDSDLVIRTIRDVYSADVARIVVDSAEVAERAREFLGLFSPEAANSVQIYDGPEPIFHKFHIEQELERLHSRHVPLKSGGSLVIDQTEALVAIDVNSGRFRTEDDAETTAYKINLEAADEIPRQLRLRDLGGVVVCDFIDMRAERHRREVERRLVNNLKQHKERAKVLRMSAFGIIEMTRQRQRASLTRSVY